MKGTSPAVGRLLGLLLILSAAACSNFVPGIVETQPTPTTSATTPSEPTTIPGSTTAPTPEEPEGGLAAEAGLPSTGRLAVIGTDANVVILQAGSEPFALTADAEPLDANLRGRVYLHPTWSPDGWLSYVRAEALEGEEPTLDVLAIRPGESNTPRTLLHTNSESYIYGYWSPAVCNGDEHCGRFAFLMNEPDTIALHMAEVTGSADTTDDVLGRAQPFYYSWSPDGDSMLWFQNGEALSVFDINASEIREELPDTPGLFQAPAWSPVDERLLFATSGSGASRITVADGSERAEVGTASRGALFFSWSPDGKHIAYAAGEIPLSGLSIVDASGGGQTAIEGGERVLSFFWSPDSTKLAIVTIEDYSGPLPEAARPQIHARQLAQTETPQYVLQWSVYDITSQALSEFAQFFPTTEQLYQLQFFDQYAQSHRVWSPDSRYIVYAERQVESRERAIRLIDTTRPDLAPAVLMPGHVAVFSFGE